MAEWTAIHPSGSLKLQSNHVSMNGRILNRGRALNVEGYFGGNEKHFFLGSKHWVQQWQEQLVQHCLAVDATRGLRVGGLLRLPLHFPNMVVFGSLWKECSHRKRDAFGQNTCCFKCSKKPCNFKSDISVLTRDSSWGHSKLPKFQCCGAVADVGSIMALEWNPAVDDVLLAISVALAYVAGIITPRSPITRKKLDKIGHQSDKSTDNPLIGWLSKEQSWSNVEDVWSIVRQKLTAALDVVGNESTFDTGVLEGNISRQNHILSLQALAKGPRLRLLWATLDHLHKEIEKIPASSEKLDGDDWIRLLSDILKFSCKAVCAQWLERECSLTKVQINMLPNKFRGDDLILLSIKKSGKENLHADLLFFLCFGSARAGGCCHSTLLVKHAIDILEDLVISVADGIATLYLELISIDTSISSNNEWPSLVQPALMPTRALERFRNEVALNRWLQHNFWSVVAIYEDRFNLWILQAITVEKAVETHSKKNGWWKKAISKKRQAEQLKDMVVSQFWLPLRRTKELRNLSGWRYCYSLYLEFSDIVGPLFRSLLTRLGNGISFLLVSLIGRSLGLIYRGIRQSINWKSS